MYTAPRIFFVNQKTSHTPEYLEFELASSLDVEGVKLPRRQMIRDFCPWVYRYFTGGSFDYTQATCPYTGTKYFTETDIETSDPAFDQCSYTLTGCRSRFGESAELPFGGFPGAGRF
jgi:lambda family phage minor tail protein L